MARGIGRRTWLATAFNFALVPFLQAQPPSALVLYRQKKFAQAAAILEPYLKKHSDDFQARLLLGLCYQQTGDRAAAERVFATATELEPRDRTARFYLARIQYLRARFPEAESNAEVALKLGEPPAHIYDLIGLIREEENDFQAALGEYEKAIAADEKYAEGYLHAGELLLKLGRASEALGRLNSAVAMDRSSVEALYQRAIANLQTNDPTKAEKDLRRALAISDYEPARRLLAEIRAGAARASPRARPAAARAPIRFRNVAGKAGLRFVLENSPTPEKHLIETMPGGVAAFDYNNDGLVDIFFTNGAAVPSLEKNSLKYFNRLFRNLGGMKFADVTEAAGLAGAGFSMGAAAGDYNNDGNVDLFVSGVDRNILYRNNGDGTFTDVTVRAGIKSTGWAVGGGWFDYDRDGLLDLFVVNYVRWSPALDPPCGDPTGKFRIYCAPSAYQGVSNTLYHNRGDGTFEDVSERSGIAKSIGKGMSVAFADYDGDGLTDIFVSNDGVPNFLFRNRGDGTFEEVALAAGAGLTNDGRPVSSMGVDFRDFDNDGRPDLVVTALARETFPLFRNDGNGFFLDDTYPSGLGLASRSRSGWGVGMFDFNNDGWKDIFSANSHVTDNIELFSLDRYRQANSIFVNQGNGRFEDASPDAGADFQAPRAHRGAAFADFNNDGKMDAVVSALGEPAELWENISPNHHHWILLRLEGTKSNRDGIGAKIKIETTNGRQSNHMTSAVGYASSSLFGVHFGLGEADAVNRIVIRWPSGVVQVLEKVAADQILKIREH